LHEFTFKIALRNENSKNAYFRRLFMRIQKLLRMRSIAFALFSICFAFVVSASAGSPAEAKNHDYQVKVMTRNMDAGTDFNLVAIATTEEEFGQAVSDTILEVIQSNIPWRAALLADEIAEAKPDVIALQEVTTWKFGRGRHAFELDQLDLLMKSLRNAGQHYKVAAIQTLTHIEIPDTVAFTDHNAILVRSGELNVLETDAQVYAYNMIFPTPNGTIPIMSGWMTADIKIRDSRFRLFNTHLASAVAAIPDTFLLQAAQTAELVAAMDESNLPVILAGDFNSAAVPSPYFPSDATPSYGLIASSGYDDAWAELQPASYGFTWPLFPEDGAEYPFTPLERIDLIFSNGFDAVSIIKTGDTPDEDGLYASDHAGVVAVFDLMKHFPRHPGKK
jgi:endonuclease/exonuclease/phosphatase family metal-dependent hydrolase